MKAKAPLIISGLLLVLSAYIFFKVMEPYSEMQDDGWSTKAQRNPFLAAELFLQKTGVQVLATHDIHQIENLPENGTIFISDVRKVLTHKRLEAILEWIKGGGHLIVAAPIYDKHNPDPLLSYFKVENHLHEQEKLSTALEKANLDRLAGKKKENKEKTEEPEDVTTMGFQGIPSKVRAGFDPGSYLTHPALDDEKYETTPLYELNYVASSESGVHFLQLYYGDGLISILSDQSIWQSDRIDELDNAYLLWLLSENSDQVIMLYGAQMASLFYYIGKYAPETVTGLLVLLLAWLFFRGRRFGTARQLTIEARRSLAEHIQASSQYYWRQGDMRALIEPVRRELNRRIAVALPGSNDADQVARLNMIAEHTGLDPKIIKSALQENITANENDFTKIMNHLQLLRNAL
ncbi:MAG: DUF4350 domain-containing protein [Gammaproteobacteria bacterium]|jgi:Domain of unknown function (DUF4350)|nr:DUF4350 domain-containing protein [Gammaproteobacteria bacterium]